MIILDNWAMFMPSILAIKPKEKYFNILFRLYYVQLLNVFCMKRTILYLYTIGCSLPFNGLL